MWGKLEQRPWPEIGRETRRGERRVCVGGGWVGRG